MGSTVGLTLFYILMSVLMLNCCKAAPQQNVDDLVADVWDNPNTETTTLNIVDSVEAVFGKPPNNETFPVDKLDSIDKLNRKTRSIEITAETVNPTNCECVPYYQCNSDYTINTDGGTQIVGTRSFFNPHICKERLSICCIPPNQIPLDEVTRPTPKPPAEQRKCGKRNKNDNGMALRIASADNIANFAEFPWMVAVLEEVRQNDQRSTIFQCGGSLIHAQIVLTAAHCVRFYIETPSVLRVRAGEWDTQTKNEILPHQDRSVRNVIIHEDYNKGGMHNNYALLILSRPFDLSMENVGTVCLPEISDNFDESRCFASGWGKSNHGKEGKFSVILKRVELPVVPRVQCQDALRKIYLRPRYDLDDSFICAGGESGKDTCEGDGGGPLVCPIEGNPDRYVQAGIVSWGHKCGENGVPSLYANVAFARDWINKQTTKAGFNITEYQVIPPVDFIYTH